MTGGIAVLIYSPPKPNALRSTAADHVAAESAQPREILHGALALLAFVTYVSGQTTYGTERMPNHGKEEHLTVIDLVRAAKMLERDYEKGYGLPRGASGATVIEEDVITPLYEMYLQAHAAAGEATGPIVQKWSRLSLGFRV